MPLSVRVEAGRPYSAAQARNVLTTVVTVTGLNPVQASR
jgi:hypothetical protein